MKTVFRLFAVLCLINFSIVLSQETFPNSCSQFGVSSLTPFTNYDKMKYMGIWFIVSLYDYPDAQNINCYTSDYILCGDGNSNIIERSINLQTNTPQRINSKMIWNRPGFGQYVYEIPDEPQSSLSIQIISTDYLHYSIEWNCTDLQGQSQCYLWILSRRRNLNILSQQKVNRILDMHHIDRTKMRKIVQDSSVCGLAPLHRLFC